MPKDDARERLEALRTMAATPPTAPSVLPSPKDAVLRKIEEKKPSILAGPPGTGKTKIALDIKDFLSSNGRLGTFQMVQFHPQYSYQDFIDGYKATGAGFVPEEGVFRKFVKKVKERRTADGERSNKIDLFVIDEINRADVSAVFGELLTLLDDPERKSIKTARNNEPLEMLESIAIIGTMNTADKNIALLDFALRRRFSFIFTPPDYAGLIEWLNGYGFGFADFTIEAYVEAAKALNARISSNPLLGKRMMLGQSLFVPRKKARNPFSLEDITECFTETIMPQLEAYLGFGAQRELDSILGSDLRRKSEMALPIAPPDVIGLVRILAGSKEKKAE